VNRITINKPFSVTTISNPESLFGVRWLDRNIDYDQNITGVTRVNADEFQGDTVTIVGTINNGGSQDLTITWSTLNVPKGLSVELYVNDVKWVDSLSIGRSSSMSLTVLCVDDGTLVEGSSTFDLIITAQ
jgi:hypothetical protein